MNKNFTVFINNELWTNVIDDINSYATWAMGGIIFTNLESVNDFICHLRAYDEYKNSNIEIKELTYTPFLKGKE